MDFELLWKDEAIIAVNKPAGLRTIRDGYNANLPYLSNALEKEFGRVWVIHRLDKDTSGVILFARSAEVHKALNTQFEQRETKKVYHTIVVGMPEWTELTISLPLRVDGDRRHRTVIDHQTGKAAETEILLLERLGVFALLSASPHTGYTHQIRAHLSAVGFPLLADTLYKSLEPETQVQVQAHKISGDLPMHRVALHAYQITFQHPVSGKTMSLEAPYPQDFLQTLERLQHFVMP